ncbi:cathepsin L-like proteinase [Rhynchophorus ferrugineus]|uniref:cathepsin L-like proteinase n=1 Tax=Rhynchophorus ferrugineus TaxID=354439 RepID=UPI003FCD6DA8
MKYLIIVGLVIVAVAGSPIGDHDAQFQQFKLKHEKLYKNQSEETQRFTIFRKNLELINEHNKRYEEGLETYTMAINQFADMTSEEFLDMLKVQKSTKSELTTSKALKHPDHLEAPDSIDWRLLHKVSVVRSGKACSATSANAATGATESAYAIKTNDSVTALSDQQMIDCNGGCVSGNLDDAYQYIAKYGLETYSSYPFTGRQGTCGYKSDKVAVQISSYVKVEENEETLKNVVGSVGPVAVTINGNYLQFYSYGVYHNAECTGEDLNHSLLLVGYNSANGVDYWTAKNSWGSSWGEVGYIRLKRGVNECGVTRNAIYPIIN